MTPNRRTVLSGLAALPVAGPVSAASRTALPPLDDAARQPRAVARFVPERYDDLFWENDRVAHRIYGPALQAAEPPSGSGIDVWGKRVRWPFMDRQLATGEYHVDHGEGVDFYDVGRGRGAGGLGVWYDDKLWTSRNFARHEILATGGDEARFVVDYAPWPVDVVRTVSERRTFSLRLGSSFTRMVSTLSSNTPDPLPAAIGIGRRRIGGAFGEVVQDAAAGLMVVHEPDDGDHGALSITIAADPARVRGYRRDADNHLMLVDVTPDEPFVYYMGTAWTRGLDFARPADWLAHSRTTRFDFSV